MITNKRLFEMITEQMNDSNESLREQLRTQILAGTNETGQSMVQELSDRYASELNALSEQLNTRLSTLQNDLKSEIDEKTSSAVGVLADNYDKKIEQLRTELNETLDAHLYEIMSATKSLSDGIAGLQKDTAVIMETLQLILTNMMLDKVKTGTTE